VLVMIHAHILDAWTLRSERGSYTFAYLNFLGGLAAPLFLWLAGLALVLAAEQGLAHTGDRAAAASRVFWRGIQIFGLAFLFRLQAFVVSPGNPLVSLLRVDILNIMGPAMAGAALVWWLAGGWRSAALMAAGVAIGLAMVTPIVRSAAWLTTLPPLLQWYVSPAGNHSTFTLFPWAGFVFAGGAAGAWLASVRPMDEPVALRRFGLAGLVLVAGSLLSATLPSIYSNSFFWTTSPTYFGARVGILMAALGGLAAASPLASHWPAAARVLQRFGRSSLFVYWIHVELVYGYATIWMHHRLPLWGTTLAFLAFAALMYGAVGLRDRVLGAWRARATGGGPEPRTVQA
jgi:uncharacterized membrane protein